MSDNRGITPPHLQGFGSPSAGATRMSGKLFSDTGLAILECSLCFERYSGLCPEHKLQKAFKEDTYLKRCVELLIEDRTQTAREEWENRKRWWQFWRTEEQQ